MVDSKIAQVNDDEVIFDRIIAARSARMACGFCHRRGEEVILGQYAAGNWRPTSMYDTRKLMNVGSESDEATSELSERFTNALKAS